jgi:hypothetical protein
VGPVEAFKPPRYPFLPSISGSEKRKKEEKKKKKKQKRKKHKTKKNKTKKKGITWPFRTLHCHFFGGCCNRTVSEMRLDIRHEERDSGHTDQKPSPPERESEKQSPRPPISPMMMRVKDLCFACLAPPPKIPHSLLPVPSVPGKLFPTSITLSSHHHHRHRRRHSPTDHYCNHRQAQIAKTFSTERDCPDPPLTWVFLLGGGMDGQGWAGRGRVGF